MIRMKITDLLIFLKIALDSEIFCSRLNLEIRIRWKGTALFCPKPGLYRDFQQ